MTRRGGEGGKYFRTWEMPMLEKELHSLCTFDLQDWLSAVLGVALWLLLREYLQPFQERIQTK